MHGKKSQYMYRDRHHHRPLESILEGKATEAQAVLIVVRDPTEGDFLFLGLKFVFVDVQLTIVTIITG